MGARADYGFTFTPKRPYQKEYGTVLLGGGHMAKELVTDALWEMVEPLLPPPKPRRYRYPGRKPIENRKALTGILFVLKSGIPWEMLPQEMGCGSGMTCWRRLRDWQQAGVWEKLHATLLARLRAADKIDWSRAVVDSASVRAVGGGGKNRPQSSGQAQAGQQAPSHHRRQWNPSRGDSDRSEPERHHGVATFG